MNCLFVIDRKALVFHASHDEQKKKGSRYKQTHRHKNKKRGSNACMQIHIRQCYMEEKEEKARACVCVSVVIKRRAGAPPSLFLPIGVVSMPSSLSLSDSVSRSSSSSSSKSNLLLFILPPHYSSSANDCILLYSLNAIHTTRDPFKKASSMPQPGAL